MFKSQTPKLTDVQNRLLVYLKNREESKTLDLMAQELNISSRGNVKYHIQRLVEKGYLKINPSNPTDYIVLSQVEQGISTVPYLEAQGGRDGRILIDYPDQTVQIPSQLMDFDTSFGMVVKIKGNSMAPNFPEGSFVMVDKNDKEIIDNKTYLVLVDNQELVIKNVSKDKNHENKYILTSYNFEVQPPYTIDFENMKIIGRVKASLNNI